MIKTISVNNNRKFRQNYKITKSSSSLSSSEANLIYIILAQISKDDKDFKEYEFTLTDLTKIMNKDINYSRLKATALSLCSKPLLVEDKENEFEIINWFSRFKYSKGVITCTIDSKLKDYLLSINIGDDRYSLVSLKYILQLKGKYSKKLYTLFKTEEFRKKFQISLEELCDMLKVPKSLYVYSQFNRAILQQAQKDMSKFSDITFEYKADKFKRKVKYLNITIKKNLNDLNTFIKTIRENYVNVPLLKIDNLTLQVSTRGHLYYLEDDTKKINKKRAYELWEKLHDNQSKLLCFSSNKDDDIAYALEQLNDVNM